MIKKISALVLALVICLSVVVMPASAVGVELGSYDAAFALEWDKDSYSAGETAYLSLYIDVKDGIAINQINTTIVLDNSVLDIDTSVKPTGVYNEAIESYFKTGDAATSWLNDSQLTRVNSSSTDDEKLLYNCGFKWAAGKNASGTHENCQNTKDGFYFDSYDSNEPVCVFEFKVKEGIADGTALNALIVSGSATGTAATAPVMLKYYKTPGSAVTTAYLAAANFDFSQAVATATIGATSEAAALSVSYWKDQIRFQKNDDDSYANKFDYRILATIDGFADIFDDIADAKDTSDNDGILEAGFIFSKTGVVDKATAIAQIDGTGEVKYSAVTNAYVSTAFDGKEYVMACYVGNIADADVNTALSALGYVKYVVDGEEKVATFGDVQTSTFKTLYDNNFSKAFPSA